MSISFNKPAFKKMIAVSAVALTLGFSGVASAKITNSFCERMYADCMRDWTTFASTCRREFSNCRREAQ